MAYPLLESPIGDIYLYDGSIISSDSSEAVALREPSDEVTYYETLRVKAGIPLFFEDHLSRLVKSVSGIENFDFDPDYIKSQSMYFISEYDSEFDGSLRVILTKSHLLIHAVEVGIPTQENWDEGINTLTLQWERVDPNLKVFRGDYKQAVANRFDDTNSHGKPYELVLLDNDCKLYEGSKSNLFVVKGNTVYSAPDDKILIGITRNRVMRALEDTNAEFKIGMFTLDELKNDREAAVFVSSTPFDILPVRYIDDVEFDFKTNALLMKIMSSYQAFVDEYIANAKYK
ncbi:MAG: aminotransferase class IV [Saccharofermentans sp.]|nr:aminotransferase class IV [Saccharofermentans sp.]